MSKFQLLHVGCVASLIGILEATIKPDNPLNHFIVILSSLLFGTIIADGYEKITFIYKEMVKKNGAS